MMDVPEALPPHAGATATHSDDAATGLSSAEVREALEGLRQKGLVCPLNTVVETYAPRFPGLRVDVG
jgi:hypothetical protein